ncbi:MAG: sugar ABC transporter substrate-binding protein [Ktedonobacteraceae bacterium]|nr:sugar ABC transporter substrate-binding protein [Ktedonobacteraceae bacterium]
MSTLLQACGGGDSSNGSNSSNSSIKWSTWGDANIMERFHQVTDKYNTDHHSNVQLIPVPAFDGFAAKVLAQLNAGVAPDVFYLGDIDIIKFIQNQTITDLTPLLNGSKSHVKPDEFFEGAWGVAKTTDGKIYGVPNDLEPLMLWYNKKVLKDAGVTVMPADLAESEKWTRDAFEGILQKVRSTGKYGYLLDNSTMQMWSWITSNGGTVYDNAGRGSFIANKDSKAIEAFQWLTDNIKSKNITYSGSLPKGQGDDLAFTTNQAAFICAGRWFLPEFKKTSGLQYDIVPIPSNTGKVAPVAMALSYMVMNKKTKNPDLAFDFLSYYVSKDGETLRLQGNDGISTPSVKGIDHIILDGKDPEHAHFFIDARAIGYAVFPAETGTPGLAYDIQSTCENLWLQNSTVQATLDKVAATVNPRIKPV